MGLKTGQVGPSGFLLTLKDTQHVRNIPFYKDHLSTNVTQSVLNLKEKG